MKSLVMRDPTAYNTPAEMGDAIGYTALVVVVVVALAVGFVSLINVVHRDDHVESFAEDFIYPTRRTGKKAKWVLMTMRTHLRWRGQPPTSTTDPEGNDHV